MSERHDLMLAFEQVTTRLDNHGAEIHSLGEKMDKKFDQLFGAFSQFKKDMTDESHRLSTRVTKLESERGMVGKVLTLVFGGSAGLVGGWLGKHLGD